ncbi:MAG TPA: oligosaccharide flippase family protein [Candidatus Acidoferrum sp.]|nr:oligosaccharide flippase family protein [Candidatus Acidoferrum sp.]
MSDTDSHKTVTRLGGQALYFLVGNVFTLVVGFPLQVFVARLLGAENLGIFSLFDAGVSLGAGMLSFGLAPTLVKFIPHCLARNDHASVRLLVRNGWQLLLLAGGCAVLVVWVLQWLRVPLPLLESHAEAAFLMALLVPLSLLIYFFQQGLRGFQEVRYMVMGTSFLQLGVKAVLAVVLLNLGAGLIGYVLAVVLSALVSCLWLARGLWRRLAELPQAELAGQGYRKEWRNFASVCYLDALVGMCTANLDRFLLGWLSGAAPVGVLLLVKQLYALPGAFFQMFMAIASPMFAAAHARDDARERQHLYHLMIDWVVRPSAPLCMFLLLFAEPLLGLYRGDIAVQGSLALRILVVSQLINLVLGPLGTMLTLSGCERLLAKLNIVDQLVWIIGMIVLLPRYGLNGAVAMTAFTMVEQNVVLFVVAKRRLGMNWYDARFLRWTLPLTATLLTGLGAHWVSGGELAAIPLAAVLLLMYIVFAAVSLLQGLHEDDKTLLSHIVTRLKPGR